MRINRMIVRLLITAGVLVLAGLAVFPSRSPDEIVALVGIPLTIYLLLPVFLRHLLPLPSKGKKSPGLRQLFAEASWVERLILFAIFSGITAAYAGTIMLISALGHGLVESAWGSQLSLTIALWFIASGGAIVLLVMGGLHLLVKGLQLYREWDLANKVVRRSAERLLM